ncbi:hypothetical protein BJ508DRAFT_337046, partial [Ascobolus immersus RN42]
KSTPSERVSEAVHSVSATTGPSVAIPTIVEADAVPPLDQSALGRSSASESVPESTTSVPASSLPPGVDRTAVRPLEESALGSASTSVSEHSIGVTALRKSSSADSDSADDRFTGKIPSPPASAPTGEENGAHHTQSDAGQPPNVTHPHRREQTPGPSLQACDDGSFGEVDSGERMRTPSQDLDEFPGPQIDLMTNSEDSDIEEAAPQIQVPPATCHSTANEGNNTSQLADTSAQPGIYRAATAKASNPIVTCVTSNRDSHNTNTFLDINDHPVPAKTLSSLPQMPMQTEMKAASVDRDSEKLKPTCAITRPGSKAQSFLPLTSEVWDPKLGCSQGLLATSQSEGSLDSEWLRDLEDRLYSRLKFRLEESFGSANVPNPPTGTTRKRKYGEVPDIVSTLSDDGASAISHVPGKRRRLPDAPRFSEDSTKDREPESMDSLVATLQAENDSYRLQIASLSETIKHLEGLVSQLKVQTENVVASTSTASPLQPK